MAGESIPIPILKSLSRAPQWVQLRWHWCRYFTGIQNGTCERGIAYASVRTVQPDPTSPNVGAMFPCVGGGLAYLHNCPERAFLTEDEAKAQEASQNAHVLDYFTKLAEGHCPHCGAQNVTKRQVGRCVYGSCGCRLYQGTI